MEKSPENEGQEEEEIPAGEPKKKEGGPSAVGLTFFVLLLVGIAALVYFQKKKMEPVPAQTARQETPVKVVEPEPGSKAEELDALPEPEAVEELQEAPVKAGQESQQADEVEEVTSAAKEVPAEEIAEPTEESLGIQSQVPEDELAAAGGLPELDESSDEVPAEEIAEARITLKKLAMMRVTRR